MALAYCNICLKYNLNLDSTYVVNVVLGIMVLDMMN